MKVMITLRWLAPLPWPRAAALLLVATLPWTGLVRAGEVVEVPRTLGPSTRQDITLATREAPGTIIISAKERTLDFVVGNGRAIRYKIGVGRDGFGWTGLMTIGAKATWPWWRPPAEMVKRAPDLPEQVPPGPLNPLGARALYLYDKSGKDSLYRIHGTNVAASVGTNVTSGCFRMTNHDVIELFPMVHLGAKVLVK
jgi:lipoprotein-anchoring transpeptidase ErfK/SrfK